MGFKLLTFKVKALAPNEERDIFLKLEKEERAVIHGVVKFPDGRPVENAVVKLFYQPTKDQCKLVPVTFAFTDKCGQFMFGVPSCQEFVIKVFFFEKEQCGDEKDCDCDY